MRVGASNRISLARPIVMGTLLAIGSAAPALAQRTTDNATSSAQDAFGKQVGDDQIGIYNADNVRGFSAIEAGNTRIEGMYFDQQAGPADRLLADSTMRVGISAQDYPFPAPTGIVDYSLRKPGQKMLVSTVVRADTFGSRAGQLDLSLPVPAANFGLQAGIGYDEETYGFGGTPKILSMALTGLWEPRPGIEVIPFWSSEHTHSLETQTLVFTAGDFLPPRVRRGVFAGQHWATNEGTTWNSGLIVKARLAGFDLAAGVFRSVAHDDQVATPLVFGVARGRHAEDQLVIVDRNNVSAATSGELRLSRTVTEGARRHTIIATLRGRDQRRLYGGSAVVFLGPGTWGEPDFRPEPELTFGPKTKDHVRQGTIGLGYQLQWTKVGELTIGVQKTDYSKSVRQPDAPLPTSKSSPWLLNVSGAVAIMKDVIAYASYSRGLEESPVAPDGAVNRSEAPPAFKTEQKDGGLRWSVTSKLSAIAGVFEITKPYFNLDPNKRFRQLGELRHRGVELSLAGELAPGLNVVAGTLFLDARVSGELADAGLIGKKPIASIKRHSIASVDYRFPESPFSLDMLVEETGDRVANSANTLVVPPRAVVALGGRYRFTIGKSKALLRAQITNLFNKYGYGVGGGGFFVYNNKRRALLTLAIDS